ncbi:MAG TPA: biotin/lipoyl-binding protein, partial [Flavobacteriales bacterium]|nr:biotin/lipoyl-binding protein [Flavobacteriales bacterium]
TALLITGCGGGGKANPGAARQSGGAMAVQVHVLQPAPLENVITGTGTLLANESVEIRSEVGGRVETIDFQEGGPATAGQLLVKINSDDLQANLRKARSELRLVELTEGRQAQLLAAKGISQETYDATQAQLSGKQA